MFNNITDCVIRIILCVAILFLITSIPAIAGTPKPGPWWEPPVGAVPRVTVSLGFGPFSSAGHTADKRLAVSDLEWALRTAGTDKLLPRMIAGASSTSPIFAQEVSLEPFRNQGPKVSNAINSFGLELYAKVSRGEKNVVFSPLSIFSCLAIAYQGAEGRTKQEMQAVLRVEEIGAPLHPNVGALIRELNTSSASEGGELFLVNALWVHRHRHYRLREGFTATVRSAYDAKVQEADFDRSPDKLVQQMNEWVGNLTNGRIARLVPRADLLRNQSEQTEPYFLLLNAIYFRYPWAQPFCPARTQPEPFTRLNGTATQVPMMHSFWTRYPYYEGPGFQALELPYKESTVSMIVLLPTKVDGLAELETTLTVANLTNWLGKMVEWSSGVEVSLPKLTLAPRLDPAGELQAMGIKAAFDRKRHPRDLFYGMLEKKTGEALEPSLFLTKVIHETWLEMTEVGTEAAGAVEIQGGLPIGLSAEDRGPKVFRADHPFMFLIYHKPSGCILFMGRVTDPSKMN